MQLKCELYMSFDTKRHREELNHTAVPTIAGYLYQYEYFIYRLLTIEPGQNVSFELFDDVAIKGTSGIAYCQAKHTIKTALGKDVQMTNRASDLWKAIDVWRKIIVAAADGIENAMEKKQAQMDFIRDNDFILVCNKKTEGNKLLDLCEQLRACRDSEENCSLANVDTVLDEISDQKRNVTGSVRKCESVQDYIDHLKLFTYRGLFLKKIMVQEESFDSLKEKCLNHIHMNLRFPRSQVDMVLKEFKSEVESDFNDAVKNGHTLSYSHEGQLNRFERVFNRYRGQPLQFPMYKVGYSQDFLDLICIKQLLKVKYIQEKSKDKIAEYVCDFLTFKNRYEDLRENSMILESECEAFVSNTIACWENEFDYAYLDADDSTTEDELNRMAKCLLYQIRKKQIVLREHTYQDKIANGAFYYLSDECLIGWHRDWKKIFKKEKQDG